MKNPELVMGILHVLNLDLLMSMYFEILFLKLDRFPGLLKLLDKNDFEVNSTIPKHKKILFRDGKVFKES